MQGINKPVMFLFDKNEEFEGVLVSAELWRKIEPIVSPYMEGETTGCAPTQPERPEPMKDWDTLVEYWDFAYPVNYEVTCDECGNSTPNWIEDSPRKFRLLSANLGGLVNFGCTKCQAKITKKHFKDCIESSTTPFCDEKDPKLNAVYG
ncbi:MAG: hypothetical protein ACNI3A_13490 [Desulfovibrio sp.]|uniref:hypothetical protein n=1 Tax=Desulfovibrio sp. 7SRBS1 TaxID=3378064 RepID=UPI003B41870A